MKNKKQFFSVLVVGLFAIALFIGCSNNLDNSNDNVNSSQMADTEQVSVGSESNTEMNSELGSESVFGTEESEFTEEVEETETEEKDLPKEAEGEIKEEESILKITPTNDDVNNGSGSSEKEVFIAPAAASQKNPIIKSTTTASETFSSGYIPAGKIWYYRVTAPKGYYFCIENTNAKITCGESESKIESGKVLLKIQNNESEIAIKNSGSKEENFTVSIVKMEDLLGTVENPYIIDSVATTEDTVEPIEVSFLAGDADGDYYQWTANQDGKLDVTISAEDAEKIDIITTVGGEITTLSEDGSDTNNGDTKTATVTVAKGDKVTIQVIAKKDGDTYPAVKSAAFKLRCRVSGSEENPIELVVTELPGSVQVVVPAGETVYYGYARNLGGMQLKVESETIEVCHGSSYNPEQGVITLILGELSQYETLGSFSVKNTGNASETYTLEFSYLEGTYNNPEIIEIIENNGIVVDHTFVDGDEEYYYQWTAPADGKMTFDISDTVGIGWQYSISKDAEESAIADGPYYSDAEEVVWSRTYDVELGEVFVIKVGTYEADAFTMPAGLVSFKLTFAASANVITATSPNVERKIDSTEVTIDEEVIEGTEATNDAELFDSTEESSSVEVMESTEVLESIENVETTETDMTEQIVVLEPLALRLIRNWYKKLFSV